MQSSLKKIIISFVFLFCAVKYSFDPFLMLDVFERKLTSNLLSISFLVNTASVSIVFEHALYFKKEKN